MDVFFVLQCNYTPVQSEAIKTDLKMMALKLTFIDL